MVKIDLTGQRFGRLLVIRQDSIHIGNKIRWICRCDCGNEKSIGRNELKCGNTKSCGCLDLELKKYRKENSIEAVHGAEYGVWVGIKSRCYNKNVNSYNNYGGRGITVCDRWLNSFEDFLNDMGKRPSNKHTIERLDSNGMYDTSNCKWILKSEQSRNRRSNRWLEYKGVWMILKDWAIYFNVNQSSIATMLSKKTFYEAFEHYQSRFNSKYLNQ